MNNKVLTVIYKGKIVGKLALTNDKRIAFQYDEIWLKDGFSISPFSLPLENKLFISNKQNFDGLFGAFNDSLPDAWGNLILDRYLLVKGIDKSRLNILDRLSLIGKRGMGALEYEPEYQLLDETKISIDELAKDVKKIFEAKDIKYLDELFNNGASSGGTRPKAYIKENDEEWLVKFPYHKDMANSGQMEYEYYLCACKCGIDMSCSKTYKTSDNEILFMTKRFDRPKRHMISASALLEVNFENSFVDYRDLMKLTKIITNNNMYDIKQMYKRMCFNVFSNNQDDHLKNFAFIFDDNNMVYRLSPAYDLTYSISGYGEHTTTVNGKGKDILDEDLLKIAVESGLKEKDCLEDLKLIKNSCFDLVKWGKLSH